MSEQTRRHEKPQEEATVFETVPAGSPATAEKKFKKAKLHPESRIALDIADALESRGCTESAAELRRSALPPKTFGERLKRAANHQVRVMDLVIAAAIVLAGYGMYSWAAYEWDLPGGFFGKKGEDNLLSTSQSRKMRLAA